MQEQSLQLPRLSLKKIFSMSSVYGIAPILDKILALLMLPVFTRYLSADRYGALMILYAGAAVIQMLMTIGLPDALAKIFWDYKGEKRRECMGTAWLLMLVLNLAVGVPLVIFADKLAIMFFHNRDGGTLIILLIASLSLSTQAIIPMVTFRARERKYQVLTANLLNIFVRVTLTAFFLVYLRLDLMGVFLADICANIATMFIYIPALFKEISLRPRMEYLKSIFSVAPYQFIVALLAWIISLSDRPIIQHILGNASEVGVYAIGYQFGSAIVFVLGPILTAWRPYAYSLNSQNTGEYDKQMGQFFIHWVSISFICFIVFSTLSADVIRILTPVFYHRAAGIVSVLLFAQIFAACSSFFLSNFFLQIKMKIVAYVYFICAIIKIALNYLLIPSWGVMGAAVSLLVAYAVMFAIMFYFSQKIKRTTIAWRPILLIIAGSISLSALILKYVEFQNPYISLTARTALILSLMLTIFHMRKSLDWTKILRHW